MDLAEIAVAYWRHYRDPEADVLAWELVDAVGRGDHSCGDIDALHLFAALANDATDDAALAYLGAGPLEVYLQRQQVSLDRLSEAVRSNDKLRRAFAYAYLAPGLPADERDRLRHLFGAPPPEL